MSKGQRLYQRQAYLWGKGIGLHEVMNLKKALEGVIIGATFVLWLLHSQLVQDSIGKGLSLCIRVVFPSLFPFFVLSHLLIGRNHHQGITSLLGPWMPKLGLPAVGATSLVLGALGGYPMGAVTTYNLYHKGLLEKQEATRLLGCSNFAGPGYIFGVLGLGVFSSVPIGCMLYLGHILAGILVARTGIGLHQPKSRCNTSMKIHSEIQSLPTTLTQALKKGVMAMATVCGCIIFFFLVLSCLDTWCFGYLPASLSCLLTGLVEMTTGTAKIATLSFKNLALVGFFLGWGGLCIHMQVHALGKLPMAIYYRQKLLHGLYGAILTPLLVAGPTWGIALFFALYFIAPLEIFGCFFLRHKVY